MKPMNNILGFLAGLCVLLLPAVQAGSQFGEYLFVPAPKSVEYTGGQLTLEQGKLIYLSFNSPFIEEAQRDKILMIAEDIQHAIGKAGVRWEITTRPVTAIDSPVVTLSVAGISPAMKSESYKLTVQANSISIVSADAAGTFYAAKTLSQMCGQFAGRKKLPCVKITDSPDFANRGVMLDVSRSKVPKMETLKGIIDLLAGWKVNQLQLYMEHTFNYRGHEKVWENASPFTGEQILELDRYCRDRFIELVPNQNSFGHMERWLIHEPYDELAECAAGCSEHIEPRTLCPIDPRSIELVAGLYEELLPHFSSRHFNVGCDETFELGKGRSKEACEEKGTGRVYLEYLMKVYDLCSRHGRRMQFWGDVILNHPELIEQLPGDVIPLAWGYEKEHNWEEVCGKFAEAGLEFYVCPGTSSWNSVLGRSDEAKENIRNAAKYGIEHGATGLLNTEWGDRYGYWQPYPVHLPWLMYGAAVSWSYKGSESMDVAKMSDEFIFRDKAGVTGQVLYELGEVYRHAGVDVFNWSVLGRLLLLPEQGIEARFMKDLTKEGLKNTLAEIDRIIERLDGEMMDRPDAELIEAEIRHGAALLKHACRFGLMKIDARAKGFDVLDQGRREEMARRLRRIITEQQRIWVHRNRIGGMNHSVNSMEKLLKLYTGK